MRTCAHCKTELSRNCGESVKQFFIRKYCNRECVFAARRANSERFKNSEEEAIRRRAEVMGGNSKITNALLTPSKVRQIRELYRPLGFTAKEIGAHLKVKEECVKKVLSGQTWRHVV